MNYTTPYVKVGSASLRTKVGDFSHNVDVIKKTISLAYDKSDLDVLLLQELVITGYGLLDFYQSPDIHDDVINSLGEIIEHIKSLDGSGHDFCVALGLPIMVQGGQLYNGVAVITKKEGLIGISCKKNLAIDGIHYESRWFRSWPNGIIVDSKDYGCEIGDLVFDLSGVRIGFEICEDSWVANRPGRDLYDRRVDIILNPSASHFAVGKYELREQFIKEGARAFGAAYVYANPTGCEEGQSIYDAGCMIATHEGIVARGRRFSFKDYTLVSAIIDISANRTIRSATSQMIPPHNNENCVYVDFSFSSPSKVSYSESVQSFWLDNSDHDLEALYALCLGTFDWQNVKGLKGSVVSLSGGADSALVSSLEYLANVLAIYDMGYTEYKTRLQASQQCSGMLEMNFEDTQKYGSPEAWVKKNIMPLLLTTIYQSTKNSSQQTRNAAKCLASGLGAKHIDWSVQDELNAFELKMTNLGFCLSDEVHDKAVQNVQARVRVPGAWYVANLESKALVCTSNLTEAWVGYFTMDGDSFGIRAPISGTFKTRVLRLNALIEKGFPVENGSIVSIPSLKFVNQLKPTAELRESEQSDEDDLMPFPVLEKIISLNIREHRMPSGILQKLSMSNYSELYSVQELEKFIEKAFKLNAVSQVKRHKSAAGFQIEIESVDPKTFSKVPLMSHWLDSQLVKLKKKSKQLQSI